MKNAELNSRGNYFHQGVSDRTLMTGCYPKRVDMATGSNFGVLLAGDKKGLNPDEITIAEVLKSVGYRTGMFGKWHLGDQPPFLPTRQGFDEYFGIPYSHNIYPYHPRQDHFQFLPLALLENGDPRNRAARAYCVGQRRVTIPNDSSAAFFSF